MDAKVPASLSPARGLTNSASFPIRAPPTNYFTDEDSGKESSLDGSDDGFVTGEEEEFDTASERPLDADPDEDVVVGSVEKVKVGNFAGGARPVAKLSVDDDDADEDEVAMDESGDGTESESTKDEAVENRALVVPPENGVLNGVHEEPSMADGVSQSEVVFYDTVDQLISNDDHNAQSGEVVDEIPEPEKRGEEFDANENEVEEPRIEAASLSSISSLTSLRDTVEEVAYADVYDDVNNDESSLDRNSEMKLDAIVELTSEDSALEEKSYLEDEENAVRLKDVSVRDEETAHEDSDQKLEQGSASDQSIAVASSSQEPIERETKEITDSDFSTKQNTSVRELDVDEHNDKDNNEEVNEPIPISAIDEEKRYSEPTEKDVNVVEESILVSKEVHCVVVEDSNTKESSGDDIIEEEKEEEVGAVRNGDDSIGVSHVAVRIIKALERSSANSQDFSGKNHGEIVTESEEEDDIGEEGDGKELFDSAALAALLEAASSAGADSNLSISSADGHNRFLSIGRPAGLGLSAPTLKPTLIASRPNITTNADLDVVSEDDGDMSEEEKKLKEKIHQIRVKFLRLVQRLGHYPEGAAASQVLYRLSLAEGIRNGRPANMALSLEAAKRTASQLEAEGKDGLDFSFNFLVIGKAGSGKSATINSIFNEGKAAVGAFEPTTPCVKEIAGIVDGVKVRVIDTPGLKSSVLEQGWNRKTLYAVRKFIQKCPPDVVLYVDRLDTQTRDFNDVPLLKAISSILGSSIWHNAIVTLTHAATAPPDGANGLPMSYEIFLGQRSQVVQQAIRQAAGDLRLTAPVALVENHPSCRVNREGERILPNGLVWRPQLLLMCYSLKIISEANSLMKLQDAFVSKLFGFRFRSLPTPYLLSSFLQSRAHPKLLDDQGAEIEDSEIDLADSSDSEQEGEEDEYDQLPPFKPLKKAQIEKLSKEQRKAYFDEYDYRVKLLERKQWKEDLRRLKQVKKKGNGSQTQYGGDVRDGDDFDQENGAPPVLSVPLLDFALPASFDGDNPSYRYRYLQPTSGLLARPVYDPHRWDHDYGFDGVSLENSLAIASRFPAAISVQVTKDKKDFNIHLDSSLSAKLGENGSSLAALDIQTMGRQLAYTFVGEAKCKTFKRNKTAAGVSVIFLGENVATGLKIEDQISMGKRVSLVGSAGAMRFQGDTMAYGANFEARLEGKDFPVSQDHQSSLGLSVLKTREDLAMVANLQLQFSIGRSSKMNVRVGLNNKKSGQITVRTSSCEQLQIALVGLLPIAASILRTFFPNSPYFN